MDIANLALEFLRIIVSWPLVAFILGIILISTFKEPLADFFRRMVRGQAYGVSVEAATPSEQQKEVKDAESFISPDEVEEYVSENPKQVILEYQRVLNAYWFERAYNLIYGTQVALLERLEQTGADGEKYVNLVGYHTEFVARSEFHSIQYADYLRFLADMKFVEYKGPDTDLAVCITGLGIDFLSYIRQQYGTGYRCRIF